MFKHKLLEIKREIENHKGVDKEDLVKNRLDKTLKLYVEQLEHSYSNLLRRSNLRVLQSISKED